MSIEATDPFASLSAEDRQVFLAVLEPVEMLIAQMERIADAIGALDKLDDQRETELRALRARVRILEMHATGQLSSELLAEVLGAAATPTPESLRVGEPAARQAYWDELARLRAKREEAEHDG